MKTKKVAEARGRHGPKGDGGSSSKNAKKGGRVPELRFPDFHGSSSWADIPLEQISTRIRKKVGSKMLTPVSITAGVGFVDQTKKFGRNIAGEQYKNYIHIKRGDFVYNKGNSKTFAQGCIYQLKEFDEAAASTAFICFKLDDKHVDHYFQNLFDYNAHGRELAKFITSGARSDGLLNINPNDFFSIELPVPPSKAEQQKIADCLGSLDGLIAAHRRKLDAFQDHKKGLLQQLFPAKGETTPKLRFSEFWNSGEWSIERAANIFSNRSTRGKRKLPIYSISQTDGLVRRSTLKRKIEDIADPSGNKTVRKGDLAYNMMRMWQGAVGVAAEDCLVSPAYVVLAPSKTVVSQFYAYYFKTHEALQLLEGHSRGLTKDRLRLYYEDFGRIPLPFPSKKEQQKIADCLSTLDALITAQTEQIAVLKTHKKGLMQQLFPSSNPTGKQAS